MTTTKTKSARAAPPAQELVHAPAGPRTVLTLAAGQFGPFGYVAGILITDVPPEVVNDCKEWLTDDCDLVAAAMVAGKDAVPYRS